MSVGVICLDVKVWSCLSKGVRDRPTDCWVTMLLGMAMLGGEFVDAVVVTAATQHSLSFLFCSLHSVLSQLC